VTDCLFVPSVEGQKQRVVTACQDSNLYLWEQTSVDPLEYEEVRIFEGHDGPVMACDVSDDGKHLVSGSKDDSIKVWALENALNLRTFEGHEDWVISVNITRDRKQQHIVSTSRDQTIRIWDFNVMPKQSKAKQTHTHTHTPHTTHTE
jgi:WD40 repeat protein